MVTRKIKVDGVPNEREYNALPFGRRIEYDDKLKKFKAGAKTVWLSQKRVSTQAAWGVFLLAYEPTQYYTVIDSNDHSFEVWYT